MIKLAMISIHQALQKGKYKSKMLLQVHDELVFDVHKSELEAIQALVLEKMESALPLPGNVPVKAEIGTGHNWLEAH